MIDMQTPECFVAMWFGSDEDSKAGMEQLYEFMIKPAIENCNLRAYQIGRDLSADKLDDEILSAIDRSIMVIVDLTHDPATGLRGSVIFEAGYAYHRKPVIWMCRDDLADSTPFDVRQFRQLRWNRNKLFQAKEELSEVITKRLEERSVTRKEHELSKYISSKWRELILVDKDVRTPEGKVITSADVVRTHLFDELCDHVWIRVLYKDMKLSPSERYELLEEFRQLRRMIIVFREKKKLFNKEILLKIVHPKLKSMGWLYDSD